MLQSRRNNNIIINFHERCLRLIYKAKNTFYEELLTTDDLVYVYHRNIQALATELCKIKNVLKLILLKLLLVSLITI